VAHNLPLQPAMRQQLLDAGCASDRLRLLLRLLPGLERLCCCACGRQLATAADVLVMTSEGIGGAFVNSAGFVHDMITLSQVAGALLTSEPDTAHSWFPGWAWTIAHCRCGQHLGWKFSATQRALKPRVFWGLRRDVLLCVDADAAAVGIAQEQEQQEQQQAGGGGGRRGWLTRWGLAGATR
jgi:cereblon